MIFNIFMLKKCTIVKLLFLSLFIFLSFESVSAQRIGSKVELTPYFGYVVGGKIRASTGDLSINSAPNFGVFVDVPVARDVSAEFYYSYQSTSMDFWSLRDGTTETLFDIDVHYFMIGAHYEYPSFNNVVWFGSAALGASVFSPKNAIYSDEWRFTFNFGGGAKIFFSERIGVRLQALLNIPIQWGGATYYYGGGASVAGGTTFVQGNFLAGLIFKI